MRFKVAILAADAYEHDSKLQYCVQEGKEIQKALQKMHIIDGDLELWLDFTRQQAFDLADRLKTAKHVMLFIACHAYQEKGNVLLTPTDSTRQDDDVPLERFTQNMNKHGSEGVFLCFFAACRLLKEAPPRAWDKSRLHLLMQPPRIGQAHVTFLGCALGEPMRDADLSTSFLGDLARRLKPGAVLPDLAQDIIKAQERVLF